MKKIFETTTAITEEFVRNGWSAKISFSELTLEEAKEKGMHFAISGMSKGRKYFKMKNGNIYDDTGKLCMFNFNSGGDGNGNPNKRRI